MNNFGNGEPFMLTDFAKAYSREKNIPDDTDTIWQFIIPSFRKLATAEKSPFEGIAVYEKGELGNNRSIRFAITGNFTFSNSKLIRDAIKEMTKNGEPVGTAEIASYLAATYQTEFAARVDGYDGKKNENEVMTQIASEIGARFYGNIGKIKGEFRPDGTTCDLLDFVTVLTPDDSSNQLNKKGFIYKNPDFMTTKDDDPIENENIDEVTEQTKSPTRAKIEKDGYAKLSVRDRYRYDSFWAISRSFASVVGVKSIFHVDHSQSVSEFGIDAIIPNNLQLLSEKANLIKSGDSWDRFNWENQVRHIKITVESALVNVPTEVGETIELILKNLENIYNSPTS